VKEKGEKQTVAVVTHWFPTIGKRGAIRVQGLESSDTAGSFLVRGLKGDREVVATTEGAEERGKMGDGDSCLVLSPLCLVGRGGSVGCVDY
jgi:hypothetical protein